MLLNVVLFCFLGRQQNLLFCLMDRKRNACVWLMGRHKNAFLHQKKGACQNDRRKFGKLNFRQYGQMEKHSQKEARTGRKSEVRRSEVEKAGKSRNTMFCGPRKSKSRLAKAAGAEPGGQMRNEKVHAVVARSRFGSKKCQNTSGSDDFGSCHVEKMQAVVARSTF